MWICMVHDCQSFCNHSSFCSKISLTKSYWTFWYCSGNTVFSTVPLSLVSATLHYCDIEFRETWVRYLLMSLKLSWYIIILKTLWFWNILVDQHWFIYMRDITSSSPRYELNYSLLIEGKLLHSSFWLVHITCTWIFGKSNLNPPCKLLLFMAQLQYILSILK